MSINSSTIIQGVIAIGSVGTIVYLAIVGQPVPEVLVSIASAIVGYYFGSVVQAKIAARKR